MSTKEELPVISDTESYLFRVELPEETRTYKPVSHRMIIESLKSTLGASGYSIVDKIYGPAREGEMFTAVWECIPSEADADKRVIMFQNSYNKKKAVKIAFGAYLEGTLFIDGEITFKKKHMGDVVAQIKELSNLAVLHLSDTTKSLKQKKDILSAVPISQAYAGAILGDMLARENIFNTVETTKMVKLIKQSFDKETKVITGWDFYKLSERIISKSHPVNRIKNYLSCVGYLGNKFGINY